MKQFWIYISSFFILMSCSSKEEAYEPVPYNLKIPELFSDKLIAPILPANNPLTEEGVALGKKLFFDKRNAILCNLSQSTKSIYR